MSQWVLTPCPPAILSRLFDGDNLMLVEVLVCLLVLDWTFTSTTTELAEVKIRTINVGDDRGQGHIEDWPKASLQIFRRWRHHAIWSVKFRVLLTFDLIKQCQGYIRQGHKFQRSRWSRVLTQCLLHINIIKVIQRWRCHASWSATISINLWLPRLPRSRMSK